MAGYFNGAMYRDLDKGITEIQYNSLNLPQMMIINSPSVKAKNYYTYSASGVKLKTEQRYDPNYTVTPSNATSPANDGLSDYKNTDYVGNVIYETVKSGSAIMNKTRILIDGGYIENGVYHYYLNDHLGNNRVVANSSSTVVQSNQYYPFGMSFADASGGSVQPYKYNGKELDGRNGLNMYDYGARWKADWYFPTVDPLAEKYYSISPYAYCNNNPLRFIDPTGMYSTEQWKKDNGITEEDLINVYSASENAGNGGPDDPPKKEESQDPLYYISKAEDIGEIAGASGSSVKDIPGTFRLQGGSNNPKIISYKYYPSGWDGSGSTVTTYSFSKIGSKLTKGAGVLTFLTETNKMMEAVEADRCKAIEKDVGLLHKSLQSNYLFLHVKQWTAWTK